MTTAGGVDMHVHACHRRSVRTTIELSDEVRGKLLALAARRGDKGFSKIVEQALERYFEEEGVAARRRRTQAALAVLGTLSERAAGELESRVKALRERRR